MSTLPETTTSDHSVTSVIGTPETPDRQHHLDHGALGLAGVLFAICAGMAPLYAMIFNVPLAVEGSGSAGPAAFLVAMVVLVIFSIGYIEMSRKVTAAGGFYSFISHGFGRIVGMGSALLITGAYLVFTAAIIGPTAYFLNGNFQTWFNIDIPVWIIMFGTLGISTLLAWFRIGITTSILGALMCAELLGLIVFAIAVIASGGNSGLHAAPLSPVDIFHNSSAIKVFGGAAVGIALFGAFWSWVGFETAPNYAEETRNPKRTGAQAMYLGVIGIGILYTLIAYVFVIGWGPDHAAQAVQAQFSGKYVSAFYPLTGRYSGSALTTWFEILTITSGFAAQLAFYNTSARYLFSMGRERILPAALGRTHPKHKSAHIASMTVTAFVGLYILGFVLEDSTPTGAINKLGTWSPLLGVMGLLLVQALVSFAIIRYFLTHHREDRHAIKTFIAPIIGGLSQIGALILLLRNRSALSGAGSVPFVKDMPYVVIVVFAAGIVLATYYKTRDPERYAGIGRFVYDEHAETPTHAQPTAPPLGTLGTPVTANAAD